MAMGLTGPRMTLGHGVWMTEDDIELCAKTGTISAELDVVLGHPDPVAQRHAGPGEPHRHRIASGWVLEGAA